MHSRENQVKVVADKVQCISRSWGLLVIGAWFGIVLQPAFSDPLFDDKKIADETAFYAELEQREKLLRMAKTPNDQQEALVAYCLHATSRMPNNARRFRNLEFRFFAKDFKELSPPLKKGDAEDTHLIVVLVSRLDADEITGPNSPILLIFQPRASGLVERIASFAFIRGTLTEAANKEAANEKSGFKGTGKNNGEGEETE